MGKVILTLLILLAIAVAAVTILALRARRDKSQSEKRRRFILQDTGERMPMAPEGEAASPVSEADGLFEDAPTGRTREARAAHDDVRATFPDAQLADQPQSSRKGVSARIVETPDGEMILTDPPYRVREAILSTRLGRYTNKLGRRLPAWIVACPRVRLDALVSPTRPDGRDAEDWANWRRRVRVRSVDLVLCDRRNWRPIVAIVFEATSRLPAVRTIAGGQDRIIDEVLRAAGLPMLRLSGSLTRDWGLIQPYVDQAILPSVSDETIETAHGLQADPPITPEAAVNLLKLDEDQGWILR